MRKSIIAKNGFLTPLKNFRKWFLADSENVKKAATTIPCLHEFEIHSAIGGEQINDSQVAGPALKNRPLRVLLVQEDGSALINPGRMVISGRMADVCAELDRLATREATFH